MWKQKRHRFYSEHCYGTMERGVFLPEKMRNRVIVEVTLSLKIKKGIPSCFRQRHIELTQRYERAQGL